MSIDDGKAAHGQRAVADDEAAFEALLAKFKPQLRSVIRRMVGHPDDTDDLVQESALRAWESFGTFRGDSAFGTWLCAIGIRAAIDHLRQQKTWRAQAHVAYSNECFKDEQLQSEVMAVIADPAFTYEAKEHVASLLSG
jgi:RNA polymerase sigma-70 factor (ECF subfamily)